MSKPGMSAVGDFFSRRKQDNLCTGPFSCTTTFFLFFPTKLAGVRGLALWALEAAYGSHMEAERDGGCLLGRAMEE